MSFLAPWFLALAAAAAVPLLIHLLRRQINLRVDFPAARYLARAEREHSRTLRMRNLLVMLLRVAAVLLLALAAARPATRIAGAGHSPTALAIVVDNSMSTGVVEGGSVLLEQFKRSAREVLSAATADDRIVLVTADGMVRGGSTATLRDELDRIRPLAGAGRMRDALASAVAATDAPSLAARHVLVLTDGQRTEWDDDVAPASRVATSVLLPATRAPANRALVLAEPRPARWTPRGALASRAISGDSATYRLVLNERTVARGNIAPNEESLIRAAPTERGWTAGYVELEPDELPADNTRHFALWIGQPPAVQVMDGAGEFARQAIEVLRSSERVVAGNAIRVASADETPTLPALIVAPSDPVRVGAANRALERLGIPWRFGSVRSAQEVVRGENLEGVTVTRRFELVPRGTAATDTLATVGLEPWIVAGPSWVLLSSPLAADQTSLPVSASFLPWLSEVLATRLHTDAGRVRAAVPSARVMRPAGVEALEAVDGSRVPLPESQFDAPATPGTWFFIRGSRRVGALVVNPVADESRLDRWSADEMRERLGANVAVTTDAGAWTDRAFSGAALRPITMPLVALALLVLGAEAVAVAAGNRRNS